MKKRCLSLLLCLCLMLSACTSRIVTEDGPAATLPPAEPGAIPHGTEGMVYQTMVPLCLPSADGRRLVTVYTEMELDRTENSARAVLEALLEYPGSDTVRSLGNGLKLSLYGRNPVEVSAGVCTVNLASSALELDSSAFYTVCLAIASTLTWQDDITAVNVLVCDQPVGLDIAGYLPAGSVNAHPGEDLSDLWELMDARRVPLGQNAADVALSSTVTLYFPLADGTGIMPQTRSITFAGQSPSQLASGLLSALGSGSQMLDGICVMPDLMSMLTQQPTTSEQPDGSRMITLYFTSDLENRLLLQGIEPICFMASIVCTLTTFIPNVSSVCIVSGSTMMTGLYSRKLGELHFRDGVQKRSQYTGYLRSQAAIYLARNGRLSPVIRTMPAASVRDPGALFELLAAGPTESEKAVGYTSVIPEGFDASDVLGAAVEGDTLSLNLSERFALVLQEQEYDEQLVCYGIATTLCTAQQMQRIRYYFASEMMSDLGGDLFWAGEFMLNASVLESGN